MTDKTPNDSMRAHPSWQGLYLVKKEDYDPRDFVDEEALMRRRFNGKSR